MTWKRSRPFVLTLTPPGNAVQDFCSRIRENSGDPMALQKSYDFRYVRLRRASFRSGQDAAVDERGDDFAAGQARCGEPFAVLAGTVGAAFRQ